MKGTLLHEHAATARPIVTTASDRQRILVVEDDDNFGRYTALLLEQQNFDVARAANGAEAIAMALIVNYRLTPTGATGFKCIADRAMVPQGGRIVIYVEYIRPRPGVSLADFHRAAGEAPLRWDAEYGEDRLIWNAARTWRLGPEPGYLTVWHSPGHDLGRIDDWDRLFRDGGIDEHERAFAFAARIEAAGCYEPLAEPVAARGGVYYAEFFRPAAPDATLRAFFAERARRHPRFTLNLAIRRIGHLAPDPGGLAVWTIPTFAALAEIATELDGVAQPIECTAAGTYVDIGHEIL